MSSKSSCPSDCGARGDVIPTLQTEEEQEALSPKQLPHYSCFKSLLSTSNNKVEQEQAENASDGPQKEELEDASSCDNTMPQKESETESASCEWSVAEMSDEEQADEKENIESPEKIKKDSDKKEKSDHSSSLFIIADAAKTTDDRNTIPFHGDGLEASLPASLNVNVLAAKNRATKSPPKSH